ncbi:phage tail tape measure protein, TP901 family, core region [Parabacteroides goldsteinii CL02T12C30]|uniref:Phage tail tape measure protein, TP901 family, core region n=1 Tax=Parabacteroides goldsteinii CL02T12C30 TaxID=999418 RepID=K6AH21_9BACT|nr:phage tail tape measure protein [Parabacteroides goldsteinii]EKN15043.1 phage tail tape measure protein, TP901 family, core region [Parabacteroides goldsteinii CL02T12C30]
MANDLNRSIKIYLDNSAAMTSADELQKRIGELEGKLLDLQTAGKGNSDQSKKIEKELTAQKKKYEDYKREVADTERVLKNLSGATYNELLRAKKEVDKQLRSSTRNTDLYNKRLEVQKNISRELLVAQKEMRLEIASQASVFSRANDFIGKYMGLIGTGIAAITGITMAFSKFRDERDKLESSSANLKALTGLDDDNVKKLEDGAKRLSTTVTEEGVRIRQSAVEIDDSFAIIGSQRPELLKNAEALEKVAQDAIYLSIAGKDKLEPAAKALTTVMNQMNLGAENSRRIINAIAAGSQAGAGNIQYITDAFEKSGTTAKLMNIELEQHIGLIEAVAPKYSEASIAGNSLDKVLLKMKEKGIGYKNGVFDLSQAIGELETRFKNGESATALFGAEHAKMAEILVMNKKDIEDYTAAVIGTNKAVVQAQINSDTNEAKRAQARNKMNLLAIDLMEKLNPAIIGAMNQTVHWTGKLVTAADWISKNSKLVLIAVSGLALYTAAIKLNSYWKTVSNGATLKATIAEKAHQISLRASTVATKGHAAAHLLLTGNVRTAMVAIRGLMAAMGMNPVTAAIIGFTALAMGVYKLWENSTKTARAIKEMNQEIASERAEASTLFDALQRSNEGSQRRKELIDEINSRYGKYLENQLTEKSTTEDIAAALAIVNEKIQENIVLKTMQKEKEDQTAKSFERQKDLMDEMRENANLGQFVTDAMLKDVKRITDEGVKNGRKWTSTYNDVIAYIDQYYGARGKVDKDFWEGLQGYIVETYSLAGNLDKITKQYSPFLPQRPANELPEVSVTPDDNKPNNKGGGSGKKMKDSEFKAAMDLKLKEMENTHSSELALLKKQKLESEQTEQYYNLQVLHSDAVYYQKRLEQLQDYLKKAGSKKVQAEINKQIVDVQTKQLEIEQKRDKEVIAALQDNRDKQLRVVESGFIVQKTVLEKAVSEQKITREQADALSLSLDAKTAEQRLEIYQGYQNDILSLELHNGPEKAKAVEDANKAVLEADLKAAQSRANQQKALQDLLKDFKGQFNLTTVGEDTELQLKVLEDVYNAKKEMAIKDGLDTTELDAAYEKAKTNILQQEEDKRYQIRQQYGLVSLQDEYEKEMQWLQQQRDQELLSLEEFEKAKAQVKIKYLKSSFDYYSDMFSGAVSALQEAELANIDAKYDAEIQRAGDNSEEVARLEKEKENKKLAVQKKYANVQFAIKVSEIIANTAVAIMQAFAQMGPIAGAIAAAVMTTTGAAQIAVANAERKKVMNMTVDGSGSSGGSGTRVATDSSSNAGYYVGGWSGDGSPYEVAGPVHKKEYVVPSFVMSEPAAMNHVVALEAMRRQKTNANPLPGSVVGMATGGYSGNTPKEPDDTSVGIPLSIIKMLVSLLTQLNKGPLKAYVVQSELQAEQDKLNESRKIGSKS